MAEDIVGLVVSLRTEGAEKAKKEVKDYGDKIVTLTRQLEELNNAKEYTKGKGGHQKLTDEFKARRAEIQKQLSEAKNQQRKAENSQKYNQSIVDRLKSGGGLLPSDLYGLNIKQLGDLAKKSTFAKGKSKSIDIFEKAIGEGERATIYADAVSGIIQAQGTTIKQPKAPKQEAEELSNALGTVKEFGLNSEELVSRTTKLIDGEEKILETYKRIQEEGKVTYEAINGEVVNIKRTFEDIKELAPYSLGTISDFGLTNDDLIYQTKELIDGQEKVVNVYKKVGEEGTTTYKAINGEVVNTKKEVEKLNKETEKTTKKQGNFGKFMATFFRVARIRVIRRILQSIESVIANSFKLIGEMNEPMKQMISSITSSVTLLEASFATMLAPLVKELEPLIRGFAEAFANVANEISRAVAQMKGLSTYTKINTKYLKEYADTAKSAFGFDTFTVLGGTNKYSDLFSDEDINKDTGATEAQKSTANSILTVISIIKDIKDNLLKPLYEKVLKPLWDKFESDILPSLKKFTDETLPKFEPIIDLIGKILLALMPITKFFNDLALTSIDKALDAIGDTFSEENWRAIFENFGSSLELMWKNFWSKENMFPHFASGGVASAGSLFVAGEAGSEMVWNNSNGSSSILNVSQFQNAMVNAMLELDIPALIYSAGQGDIYLDSDKVGTKLGQSKALKTQLNRSNPSLNLL